LLHFLLMAPLPQGILLTLVVVFEGVAILLP